MKFLQKALRSNRRYLVYPFLFPLQAPNITLIDRNGNPTTEEQNRSNQVILYDNGTYMAYRQLLHKIFEQRPTAAGQLAQNVQPLLLSL